MRLMIEMRIKLTKHIVIPLIMMGFIFVAQIAFADRVYFKNGFKTEGEVKRTAEGIWVNGGLFKEDEIERIEASPVAPAQPEKSSWYDGIMNTFGKKEETPQVNHQGDIEAKRKASLEAYKRRMQQGGSGQSEEEKGGFISRALSPQTAPRVPPNAAAPNQRQQAAMNLIQQLIPGGKAKEMDLIDDTMNHVDKSMANYGDIMNHALQLQQQAVQRQQQIQQEIMMAEEGFVPEDYLPPTNVPTIPTYDPAKAYESYSSGNDYSTLKSKGNSSSSKSSSYGNKEGFSKSSIGRKPEMKKLQIGPQD